jgi:hypothetical protein
MKRHHEAEMVPQPQSNHFVIAISKLFRLFYDFEDSVTCNCYISFIMFARDNDGEILAPLRHR